MLLIFVLASKFRQFKVLSAYAFTAVACVLAINSSLLRNHYWTHNAIMFVPYAVPIFFLIFLSLFNNGLRGSSQKAKVVAQGIGYVLVVVILLAPARELFSYGRQVLNNRVEFNAAINDRRIDDRLLNFLRERNQSFLVIESPIYHMLLNERRIGDGHPAMFARVLSGRRLGPIGDIHLYSNEVFLDPCLSLTRSGKQIIVVEAKSSFNEKVSVCLSPQGSGYKKTHINHLDDYEIFLRL